MKLVNSLIKNEIYLKKSVSKLVVYRVFLLSKSLRNYWYNIVLIWARMKPPKEIKFVSVKCNPFIKPPRYMKGCFVTSYIKVHIPEGKEIKKY